jgi:hypothetical protein
MKTTKNNLLLVFTCTILTTLLFPSCRKADTMAVPVQMGHLYFHLHTNIGPAEADSGNAFPDANGRNFLLTYAQFYISGITLYSYSTNTPYTLPANTVVMKSIDQEDYYVADVPVGNYGSISYNIGLTPTANLTNPGMYPAANPLAAQPSPNAPMYWNASQGYIFLNIQGLADTTAAHNGPVNFPFSYQIGSNSMLEHVQLPQQQFTILPGQITFIHQVCDYGNLLQGINFVHNATPFNSDSTTARKVANRVSANLMRYEMATVQP